jgi:hypothetical protein
MFLETKKVETQYSRPSKLDNTHTYTRYKTVAVFQCDNCNSVFTRELGKMSRKRLNNDYGHVCANCNPNQFAQKKGVERRKFWNISIDSDIDVSQC